VLQRGLKAGRDRPAILSLEGSWTWAELEDKANRLAAHYLALGLEPGDRIASLMPNRIALIAHYLRRGSWPCRSTIVTRRPRSTTR
jgi:acyl-CoA synthetase (AMP-forming)/AMP-acid ligase II